MVGGRSWPLAFFAARLSATSRRTAGGFGVLGVWVLAFWGFGVFRVLGFGVLGGFGFWGLGFWGVSGFRVWGFWGVSGFRVLGFWGFGFAYRLWELLGVQG